MTQSQHFRTVAAASALAVAAFTGIAASSGQAKAATDILYCQGAGRQMVRECCQTLVKRSGLPLWMRRSGRNCTSAAVVCSVVKRPTIGIAAAGNKPKIICKYVVMLLRDGGGEHTKQHDTPHNRSPNGRTAGKP